MKNGNKITWKRKKALNICCLCHQIFFFDEFTEPTLQHVHFVRSTVAKTHQFKQRISVVSLILLDVITSMIVKFPSFLSCFSIWENTNVTQPVSCLLGLKLLEPKKGVMNFKYSTVRNIFTQRHGNVKRDSPRPSVHRSTHPIFGTFGKVVGLGSSSPLNYMPTPV